MDYQISLLAKYLTSSLSHGERQVLSEWRTLSSENQQLFSEITKLRLLKEYTNRNNVQDTAVALTDIRKKIYQRTIKYGMINAMKYAAIIALTLMVSLYGWKRIHAEKYTTISVAANEPVKKIRLKDSTFVWLNALSELRIPHSFSSSKRHLFLKGEAFFDVKKNTKLPFFVSSRYMTVKVTGTSFNLFVDKNEKHVETILVSGKVILQGKSNHDVMEMSPGEKVTYNSDRDVYTVKTVDTNTFTAWHLDQIIFENATLREIVNKLSVMYDVNINLQSKQIADRRYRCVINREESLKEVLDILTYLAPIYYRIEGDEVFITQ